MKSLSEWQTIIADQCEALMRSFAKVGIIALVDEATGYQYEREQDALQEIHKLFIAEELQPYSKQFNNEFYREIFRLNGWPYTVNQIKYGQRPSVIGKWTKRFVYGAMPNGILEILLQKTPRRADGSLKNKLFQHLTKDDGIAALNKQIDNVTLLMNVSTNWNDFERLWNKKYGQQELDFGSAAMLEPHSNNNNLSDFNKNLKKGLDFNSNK